MRTTESKFTTNTRVKVVTETTVQRQFKPEDWTIPLRTVGLFEYTNSILEFEDLIEMSSADEIEVFNEIISEQAEYAFFSSSDLDSGVRRDESLADRKRSSDKKQSLQWMLALARIEIGAGVSMYGRIGNAFELLRPASFGAEEYSLLVAADAEAHSKAMMSDQALHARLKKSRKADSDTIAYMRRLKVVNDMVEYVKNNNDQEEVVRVAAELLSGVQEGLNKLGRQASIATIDFFYRSEETGTRSGESENTATGFGNDIVSRSPITRACQRLFLDRHGANPGR